MCLLFALLDCDNYHQRLTSAYTKNSVSHPGPGYYTELAFLLGDVFRLGRRRRTHTLHLGIVKYDRAGDGNVFEFYSRASTSNILY